jgi:hypothetical protein
LQRYKRKAVRAKRSTPSATPTPIPADAPTEKPAGFACADVLDVFEALYVVLDVGLGEVMRDVKKPEIFESI